MPFEFGSKVRNFIRNNVETLIPLINDEGKIALSYEQMTQLYEGNWLNDCPKYPMVVLPLHLGDENFANGVWIEGLNDKKSLHIFIARSKEAHESQEIWNERKSKTLKNWYIPLMDKYTDW
jgi:hypothetical protein